MPSIRNDLHEDFHRTGDEAEPASSNRNFGLVFAGFFGVLALHGWYVGRSSTPWLVGAAVILAGIALVAPRILAWPNWLWQKLALALHAVVSPVVLAIMFFAVLTPMAAIMRLAGKDPMRRRRDPTAPSYWITRQPPGPAPDSMRHQF